MKGIRAVKAIDHFDRESFNACDPCTTMASFNIIIQMYIQYNFAKCSISIKIVPLSQRALVDEIALILDKNHNSSRIFRSFFSFGFWLSKLMYVTCNLTPRKLAHALSLY